MKNALTVFIATALLSAHALAEIREAPTMKNAIEGADKDTLVIFDLDNTVMMPPQTLGSEEWYDYFVEKRTSDFKKQGMTEETAKEKAIDMGLQEWDQFHQNAKVIAVEKETPELIKQLQNAGVQTMALTARPETLAQATLVQLKSIGIEFNKRTVAVSKGTVTGKYPSLYNEGVLLVGPKNNKGEVLSKFLSQEKLNPKKIIFVDNKQKHVGNVEKALAGSKISYFGRRHGAADKKISSMDKAIVETQHRYFFGEVLSDSDAKKLVK